MRPLKIALYIWSVIVLLGVVCWFVPADGWKLWDCTLRFPTLSEALDMESAVAESSDSLDFFALPDTLLLDDSLIIQQPDSLVPALLDSLAPDSFNLSKQSEQSGVVSEPLIVNNEKSSSLEPLSCEHSDSIVVNHGSPLSAFFLALDSVASMPVRVVHYGDSQIEEDRITDILREQWQKKYGGGGAGLLPLHQTIPTRTLRQWISINGKVQTAQGGPKRYLVYGPRSMRLDTTLYGVMGQVAMMDSTKVKGSEDIVMNIEPINKKHKPHNYFNRLRVLTDSVSGYVIAQDTTLYFTDSTPIIIPDSTTKCEIHLHGKGNVYGISLETATGVIVDNIPMRGCSGNIFTKMDSAQLSQFYRETNTRLIILQFGGNMIPQTENPSTISGYVRTTLRQQVRYLKACAPQASILFIGPSDMSTNIDGKMTTYPLVPYMDKQLKKMADEEQIAYWSIYNAMGGYNSMVTWVEKGLAGSDYVHFTRAGANNIGKKLYNWIEER